MLQNCRVEGAVECLYRLGIQIMDRLTIPTFCFRLGVIERVFGNLDPSVDRLIHLLSTATSAAMASLRRPSVYMPSVKVSLPPSVNPRRDGPSTSEGKDGKRNARKSRVGDAIKKRLSMRSVARFGLEHRLIDHRYAGGDEVMGEAPPMPGKPSAFLTAGSYAPSRGRAMADVDVDDDEDSGETRFHQFASPDFGRNVFEPTDGQDEVIRRRGAADMTRDEEWDLEELGKDGFDLNDFMRRTLTGADEEEVKRFKAALMRQKDRNGADLQRNVFKQYVVLSCIAAD